MAKSKGYEPNDAEPKWQDFWESEGIHKFNPDSDAEVYSVDTPPPTVSGKMHLGHAFSYSQQDFIVRFKRMNGYNIFYPFGVDNNGIPTERLVEKMNKIRAKNMKREEFIEICLKTLQEDLLPKYISDWKKIGMSCDISIFYATMDKHCQKISQRSFIELYQNGREYRKDAPTMWCPECHTGISQVECEDKELDSTFNDIVFKVDGKDLVIATTRPELIPACVAIFHHPEDERYTEITGKTAKAPLFDFEVPIMPDIRADPEKGTGAVMCCTFGDQTDMEWQKAHDLPIKMAISEDGRITEIGGKYEGMKIKEARKNIIADLKESGLLTDSKPIKHAVNVHERCGTEIEILKSKQWFIKYLDLKEDMIKWGKTLNWYPDYMRHRYEHWVNGLQWDWLISRQRYFGIPFPVWYCSKCDEVILAKEEDLPVDPLNDKPPVDKCPSCGNASFNPEKDILDTWATSSLTPHLAAELFRDKPVYEKIYPMDLRPQAHDIITFWLFNTVVKSNLHDGVNPWKDVVISGHAQDPRGRKMSKSKGNAVEPHLMIDKYCADSLRFWAAGSKLGEDLPFSEKDLVTGQKFITKIWNASKFVNMHLEDFEKKEVEHTIVDKWLLTKLSKIIKSSSDSFEKYEYSKTKMDVEKFFWQTFCDNYLEIVKHRLYKPEIYGEDLRESGRVTLHISLLNIIKLMAPIMPHITEELYQKYFADEEDVKSVHISSWPKEVLIDEESEKIGDVLVEAVQMIRKAKSELQMSLAKEVENAVISAPEDFCEKLKIVEEDLLGCTKIINVKYNVTEELKIDLQI